MVDAAAQGQVVEAGHVVWIAVRGVREDETPRRFLSAASGCRVVMSDLCGRAALVRVYLLRFSGFPTWLGTPGIGWLAVPVVVSPLSKVVPGILAHQSKLGKVWPIGSTPPRSWCTGCSRGPSDRTPGQPLWDVSRSAHKAPTSPGLARGYSGATGYPASSGVIVRIHGGVVATVEICAFVGVRVGHAERDVVFTVITA